MLLSRTVTYFAMNVAVNILYLQIFNILMALKTGLLSGIVDLNRCIIIK